MTQSYWKINKNDILILRELYMQKKALAQEPVMQKLRHLWTNHASLNSQRPMILAETQGVLDELIPLSTLVCQEEWARQLERGLRELIFRCEFVKDDYVVEPRIEYLWDVQVGDLGVERVLVRGNNEGKLGSYHWDPPIKDLNKDLDKLHFRSRVVDREKTLAWKNLLEENFGDILPVTLRGMIWWTTGLTSEAINLIGLEQLMLAMYDHPEELHRLMAFLKDETLDMLNWYEREQLLPLNNENDYVGSGSIGYTTELPQSSKKPGDPVRIQDLWGLCESQETVGVSPRMYEKFIFPYEKPIIERFGLSYYGCCEPLHTRIKYVKQFKNLRRLSVSPWCDQNIMAKELGSQYIFCRKPNPTLVSTEIFHEDLIQEDIRTTLRAAHQCSLEIVMKDVHTLSQQAWRLGRWVEITREVCREFGFDD